MSRLIDADLLEKEFIKDTPQGCEAVGIKYIYDLIKKQPTANEWILCSERLPGKHRDVFQVTVIRIQDGYKWVQSMLWNVGEWKWWEEDEEEIDDEYYKVIAWMPLPQPYTKNRKES